MPPAPLLSNPLRKSRANQAFNLFRALICILVFLPPAFELAVGMVGEAWHLCVKSIIRAGVGVIPISRIIPLEGDPSNDTLFYVRRLLQRHRKADASDNEDDISLWRNPVRSEDAGKVRRRAIPAALVILVSVEHKRYGGPSPPHQAQRLEERQQSSHPHAQVEREASTLRRVEELRPRASPLLQSHT